MKILGISFGEHCCGITLLEDDKIVFSLEEERHVRVKTYDDFYSSYFRYPMESIRSAIDKFGLNIESLDKITSYYPEEEVKIFWEEMDLGEFPSEKFIFIDHHDAHAATAYYLSDYTDDALVVTLDASGGEFSGKYFTGSKGELKYIDGLSIEKKSFGHLYSLITEFLGFKRLKDEGKVVGMAAHGEYDDMVYTALNDSFKVIGVQTDDDNKKDGEGVILGKLYSDFYTSFYKELGSKAYMVNKSDIAYTGQLFFEEKVLTLFDNLHKLKPNLKKVALAGGIFANVKLNKKINELEWVDEVFIAPTMGDEGCALGCALMTRKRYNPELKPFRLKNMYLGTNYSDLEVGESYWDLNKFSRELFTPKSAAKYLSEGKIIGVFNGRYEHGPRALGNRSIIGEVTNPETYDKINKKLQRNDFMPFAPAVMSEYAGDVFEVSKSKYTAEFMTMLYDTKPEWSDKIPTVVHPVDKTARIQIVTDSSNPTFHNILKEYNDITGVPILLNTSFNVHREPIVCHPNEAFNHLDNGVVDLLIINNFIYRKYEGNIN